MLSGNLSANYRSEDSGTSARVYKNGVYGFSSIAETSDEASIKALKAASENADFLSSHAGLGRGVLPTVESSSFSMDVNVSDPEQKFYIEFAKEIDDYIAKKYPSLAGRFIGITVDSMEKLIAVSNGTDAHTIIPRSYIIVDLTTLDPSGVPVELFQPFGGYGALDANLSSPSCIFAQIDDLYERLMKKSNGVYAEAGKKRCILNGKMAGMLAHEAVGHTVEADLVLAGSVAKHNLGKRVASELVNLVDFAHTAFGKPAPLPVYVDDEGITAKDAWLIKDGILTGYMNNRESAEHFGVEPVGNARAFSFSDEPLIRMRNTAILPGSSTLEEMIESVEDGYYLVATNNGQADTTGEFMFGVTEGYVIKNGKLGPALRDTTVSGVAFDMLKTVDMVSGNLTWTSSGMCGKKQPMPVGMGGPDIRCEIMVGGR